MDGWNNQKLGEAIEQTYKDIKNWWLGIYYDDKKRSKVTIKLLFIVIFLQIINLIK